MNRDNPGLAMFAAACGLLLVVGLVCAAGAVWEWYLTWTARWRRAARVAAAPSTQDVAPPPVDETQAWADFVRLYPDVDHRLNRIDRRAQVRAEHREGDPT